MQPAPLSSVPAYDFLAPPRIVFGWGRFSEIGALAVGLGRRAFVVSGSRSLSASGVLRTLEESLAAKGVSTVVLGTISHEPEVDDVDAMAAAIRQQQPGADDLVIGIGGGSAIDLAKAVSALATNTAGESVRDYLEGVGRGLQITEAPLPMIAVPTTAGTGSEATKNAVISCYDPPFKKSLRSDRMVPRVVLVDPQLTVGVPPSVTAATGMDAITQLIESYISRRAKPMAQALAIDGLRRALPAVEHAVADGGCREAREAMAYAALLSGMALANSGLGMAHGVAAALGVHCRVAHGAACALMLPVALRVNREVSAASLAELSRAVGLGNGLNDSRAGAALISRIEEICVAVGVPRRLSELGVTRAELPALVRDSRGNSMDGNPREVSDDELTHILEDLL